MKLIFSILLLSQIAFAQNTFKCLFDEEEGSVDLQAIIYFGAVPVNFGGHVGDEAYKNPTRYRTLCQEIVSKLESKEILLKENWEIIACGPTNPQDELTYIVDYQPSVAFNYIKLWPINGINDPVVKQLTIRNLQPGDYCDYGGQ